MKWIKERDALIAQTLAFVQSVTGKKDDLHPPVPSAAAFAVTTEIVTAQALPDEADRPPQPLSVPPPRTGDFRGEMQARIANFRKHQERFEREREEYCTATLTKLRTALRDAAPPPVRK